MTIAKKMPPIFPTTPPANPNGTDGRTRSFSSIAIHAAMAASAPAALPPASATSPVIRQGMMRQNLPLGWRQTPGVRPSLRHRVEPISRASARMRGLNAMTGGLPWISTGTRNTAVPLDSVLWVSVSWPGNDS